MADFETTQFMDSPLLKQLQNSRRELQNLAYDLKTELFCFKLEPTKLLILCLENVFVENELFKEFSKLGLAMYLSILDLKIDL